MQFAASRCQVTPCGLRQPPRLWVFNAKRPRVHRGCMQQRHASLSGRLHIVAAAGPSTSPVEQHGSSGAPVAAEVAASEVPGTSVATPEAFEAADRQEQAKPDAEGFVDASPPGMTGPLGHAGENSGSSQSAATNGQTSSRSQASSSPRSGGRPQGGGGGGARRAKKQITVGKDELVPGAEFQGTVVSVVPFGAFVDIGTVTDGLVHVSEMADAFISDTSAVVQAGEVVNVRVVSYEEDASRLALSMRSATETGTSGTSGYEGEATRGAANARSGAKATASIARKVKRGNDRPIPVKEGDVLEKAKVDSVLRWGAFVDVGNGHKGLLHVDNMKGAEDLLDADAKDIMKPGLTIKVTVGRIADGKIQLTQTDSTFNPDDEQEGDNSDMAEGEIPRDKLFSGLSFNKTRKTGLGSVMGVLGFAPSTWKRAKFGASARSAAAAEGSRKDGSAVAMHGKTAEGVLAKMAEEQGAELTEVRPGVKGIAADGTEQYTPPGNLEEMPDMAVQTEKLQEAVEGVSDDTPAAKAAEDAALKKATADASSLGEGNDLPADMTGATAALKDDSAQEGADAAAEAVPSSGAESDKAVADDALKRQTEPQEPPTPEAKPVEAKASDAVADTANKSDTVQVSPPSDASAATPVPSPAASPAAADAPSGAASALGGELAKGIQDEALKRQIDPKGPPTPVELPPEAQKAAQESQGTSDGDEPSQDPKPPSQAPPEVAEGDNPDAVKQVPGTAEETEVQVTAPEEPEQAKPEEVAEGEESPAETKAAASNGASESAAALSGAAPASELPGPHSQVTQAAPAKPAGQGTTEAERTAPPASSAASTSIADSASSAAAGTSSSSAGGGGVGGIPAQAVKQLRQDTGAGMMDCKRALTEANGDFKLATEALRKKGLAAADKKAGRIAGEGLLAKYIHAGSRLGVMLEINCETDFVAKGDIFKTLCNDMAMQVAACPQVTVVQAADVPANVIEKERSIQLGKEDILKKPEQIRGKIVDGRVQKFLSEQSLLDQEFIKDTSKTVATVIKEATAATGEKISIRRFERYHLGEGIEKKQSDLAADVEQQQQASKDKAAEKKAQGQQEAAPAPQQPDAPTVKVDAKIVKQLRESTGAGMMDCKKALASCDSNLDKATDWLRKKGLASADKKAGRVASEGAIGAYIHAGSKLGVLIEVNCETDFVARGAKFKELVQDLAMQAAASSSAIVVNVSDVPEEEIENERRIEMGKEDIQSKPEAIRPKIVEGRLNKIKSQMALLEQDFIKDTNVTVSEHIKQAISSLGENIQVRRFVRYNLGEGIEKKTQDFAAEVAAATGLT